MKILVGVELMGNISRAEVKGAFLGSTSIDFRPKKLNGGRYQALIKTAGSVTLLLQVQIFTV